MASGSCIHYAYLVPKRYSVSCVRRLLDHGTELLRGQPRDDLGEPEGLEVHKVAQHLCPYVSSHMHSSPPDTQHFPSVMRGLGWRTDLARVLQHILPVVLRDAATLLQSLQVCKLPVLAEGKDEEIVELLGLLGPLALDDARAGPRCLANVMRVLLFIRATGRACQRCGGQRSVGGGDGSPQLLEGLRDRETAVRGSPVRVERLCCRVLCTRHRSRERPSLENAGRRRS